MSFFTPLPDSITLFLVQAVVVIVLSRLLNRLFRFIKQPPVVAEIISGIILGPSVLGFIPNFRETLFPSSSMAIFNVFANIGLIFFMFIVGLEIDVNQLKNSAKTSIAIGLSSIILPFVFGIGIAYLIFDENLNPNVSFLAFMLFVAVAMSITAFPVLARILTETKLMDTLVGQLSSAAAALGDVLAWCLLALVVSIAKAESGLNALWTLLLLLLFVCVMLFFIRPLFASFVNRRRHNLQMQYEHVVILVVIVLSSAWFTEAIGIHPIFGGFLVGVIVPRKKGFAHKLLERFEDLVMILFLPLYFTYSGLQTNISSLSSGASWGLVVLIIFAACCGKLVGATMAAKLFKVPWRESFILGILMNTRGLVELIVLNVGLQVGVLDVEVFTMFVLMAIVTTVMTTPLLYLFYLRQEDIQTRNEEEREVSSEKFSVLTVVRDASTVPPMLYFLSTFLANGSIVKLLFLKEISDRPSSYFFSEFTSVLQDTSLTKANKLRKNLLEDMRNSPRLKGITLQQKVLSTSNLREDVCSYVNDRPFQLALFDLESPSKASVEVLDKQRVIDIRSSISLMDEKIKNFVNWNSSMRIVEHALRYISCNIAVFVNKDISGEGHIGKILVIYTGKHYESILFRFLHNVDSSTTVVRIITDEKKEIPADLEAFRNKNAIIPKENPLSECITEVKFGYDLMVLASDRQSADIFHSETIQNSKVPVLVLFPEGPVVELP